MLYLCPHPLAYFSPRPASPPRFSYANIDTGLLLLLTQPAINSDISLLNYAHVILECFLCEIEFSFICGAFMCIRKMTTENETADLPYYDKYISLGYILECIL